jgi:8-oxo-dGTP pyrophosphatase MutT (NUDIX family)
LCKNNFEKNFLFDGGAKLQQLISESTNQDCIWEFPKGRKANRDSTGESEPDLNTAIREFEEETGISSSAFEIIDTKSYTLMNISNNIKYINQYYLVQLTNPSIKPKINYGDNSQLAEITDIRWMDSNQINIIDPTKKLFHFSKMVNKLLRKKYHLFKFNSSYRNDNNGE